MKRFIYLSVCLSAIASVVTRTHAEDVHWITGEGKNTDIPTRYGTATAPLDWFDATMWFTNDPRPNDGAQTPNNAIPLNGQSVAHTNSCCNPQPFVTIDNGGAGVNLPNSNIRFDAKTNLFDGSAGDLSDVAGGSYNFAAVDDSLIANTIAFNGAGGAANDVYVPVIADTFTSNRHGANFFAPITVNNILAESSHQDKWSINVSPTGTIALVDLDERRGPDGGSIDGSFAFNADTDVTLLEHTWSRLRVGAGAILTVDTVNYWDYTNKASDNNINPVRLDGDMIVTTFDVFDVASSNTTPLASGTYGRIGHGGVDHEVAWIESGDGVLTVGSQIPEPSTLVLAVLAMLGFLTSARRRSR